MKYLPKNTLRYATSAPQFRALDLSALLISTFNDVDYLGCTATKPADVFAHKVDDDTVTARLIWRLQV